MAKRIITIPVTLSYPNLDKARAPENGKGAAKFSAAFILYPQGIEASEHKMANGKDFSVTPEDVKKQVAALEAALMEAAEDVFGTKAAALVRSKSLKWGLRYDAEAKGYPEGTVWFNARSSNQPGLAYSWATKESVAAGKPVVEKVAQDDIKKVFYPGSRVIASVSAFFYDNESKGVTFGLNNIQIIGDGPRLDGAKSVEDEFSADTTLTPADLATLEG
jgi:hypothetical protein